MLCPSNDFEEMGTHVLCQLHQEKDKRTMKKIVVTSLFAAMILAISTCITWAQTCSPCGPSNYPSYQQFCQQNYGDSCVGQSIFNDKMVRPFNHGLSACCDPCSACCFGVGLGRFFGRNVPCAGPDFGYTYTPGYGANGQGLTPRSAWGYGADSRSPSYTYRSPRDFLNPNPPSIGY